MNIFVAFNLDAPGMSERREALLPEHRDFMVALGDRVLWGGPLLASDGATKLGGMYAFRATDLQEAREISGSDPFVKGGIFQSSETHQWRWQSGASTLERP